jgi:hypothetical protein
MKLKYNSLIFFILSLNSCIKVIDGPIDIQKPNFTAIEIPLTKDYSQKVYYSLATKSIVKTTNTYSWDIAFTSDLTRKGKVLLNYAYGETGGKGMNTLNTDFDSIYTASNIEANALKFKYANFYDINSNLFDNSLSYINNELTSNQNVFILVLEPGRVIKVQILQYTKTNVVFRHGKIDNTDTVTVSMPLNPNNNYNYYSFKNKNIVSVEPSSNTSWDIEFTKYTTLLTEFNSTRYYAVTGAILNPSKSLEYTMINNINIDNVDIAKASIQSYKLDLLGIGYSWKKFSSPSSDGFYTIEPRTYIVKEGPTFYSIQFTEFSKLIGTTMEKGYPQFLQNNL